MKTTKTNKGNKKPNNTPSSLKLRNLRYYLSQTVKSLWRNKLMSVSSVLTVAACMIMIIVSFVATTNVSQFLRQLEDESGITVLLEDDLTDAQRQVIMQSILMVSNVSGARIIDPDEALRNLEHGEWLYGLEGLIGAGNPLRYSIVVETYDLRLQEETIERVAEIFGVYFVTSPTDLTDILINLNNGMAIVGLALIALFAIFSIIIITNTIKLTVNNRRNEIIIMKYVGATDWFIRWPFVIEGILIGIIGGVIPLVIAWFTYDGIVAWLSSGFLSEFTFRTIAEIFPFLTPIVIFVSAGIGVLGSVSSMRKHLNV